MGQLEPPAPELQHKVSSGLLSRFMSDEQRHRLPPRGVLTAIAAGGAVGAVARWVLSEAFPVSEQVFPWTTFIENVVGSFLLGLAVAYLLRRLRSLELLQPFLSIGVLGSFTTFSNLSGEALQLFSLDRAFLGMTYLACSVGLGLIAAGLGVGLGRALAHRRTTQSDAGSLGRIPPGERGS